jgi:hypothetical protein
VADELEWSEKQFINRMSVDGGLDVGVTERRGRLATLRGRQPPLGIWPNKECK